MKDFSLKSSWNNIFLFLTWYLTFSFNCPFYRIPLNSFVIEKDITIETPVNGDSTGDYIHLLYEIIKYMIYIVL